MAYKSVLTVLLGDDLERSALDGAVAFCEAQDAHLEVLSLGVDVSAPGYYYAGANAMIEQQEIERARAAAVAGEEAARAALAGTPVRWTVTSGVAHVGTVHQIVGQHARFSDIAVLPLPYGEGRSVTEEAVLEAALFDGQVPVLVLSPGTEVRRPKRIVVAWNQSGEAMAAIRSALPLLRTAEMTDVVVVDPPQHAPDRSDPGGALSQMLSRHGAKPEVSVIAKTMPRMGDVLTRHCQDREADLLVMGAYGHSRFREAILGGATRDMLEAATLPVLMHH